LLGRAPYDRTLRFLEIKLSRILTRGTKGDTLLEWASRLKVGWIITGLEPWTETVPYAWSAFWKFAYLWECRPTSGS